MSYTAHTETYKGFTIEVEQDEDAFNPRENSDCFGHMICFHRRYELGDKHDWNPDEFKAYLKANEKDLIVLPLWLYDHSGLWLDCESFYGRLPQGHAEFDSGVVGVIYVTLKEVREEYGVKRVTHEVRAKAERLLKAEVKEHADYLAGNVWFFTVTDANGVFIDSCGGYIGDPDDDYILSEARGSVDAEIKARRINRQDRLKELVKNHVPLEIRERELQKYPVQ